jgi:NADH:ubiquinone oxidoreductase subunit E/NAD-dependent dihydropyrimidine dehydrogenase PreA subunit
MAAANEEIAKTGVHGKRGSVLIVGGGISGIQSSLDLADAGFKVYLVDENRSIGGTMPQLDKTFPTNDCSMCILAPKLVATARHPNIKIITAAEVKELKGEPGNFTVKVLKHARSVDEEVCNGCGLCVEYCPVRYVPQLPEEKDVRDGMEQVEIERLEKIISGHKRDQSALVPVLEAINEEYNYLPADAIRFVSQEMDIPLSQVYNVATFFTAFSLKPRGRHTIKVCLGTACHVRGAPRILEEITRELEIEPGQTTKDGEFTLETVNCLGTCALGPVVVIDDEYHMVKPGAFSRLLADFKEGNAEPIDPSEVKE